MKRITTILLVICGLVCALPMEAEARRACTGSKTCKVCKNCKYCKHCSKPGNSCGVCKK